MKKLALIFLVACKSDHGTGTDAAPVSATVSVSAPVSVSATAPVPVSARVAVTASARDASALHDFEDQFSFGGLDAGSGDASRLATRPGYEAYTNGRFGFALDVPHAFDGMPDPENGDGRQWRIGKVAAMTASGMQALGGMSVSCANTPNVTAHNQTKTTCWSTGKRGGWIFWERQAIAHDMMYSLRFQYVDSMKAAMDPVVTHVNASWTF